MPIIPPSFKAIKWRSTSFPPNFPQVFMYKNSGARKQWVRSMLFQVHFFPKLLWKTGCALRKYLSSTTIVNLSQCLATSTSHLFSAWQKGKSTFAAGSTKISFPQQESWHTHGLSGFSTVSTGFFPHDCSKAVENKVFFQGFHKGCGNRHGFPTISSYFPQPHSASLWFSTGFSTVSTGTKKKTLYLIKK